MRYEGRIFRPPSEARSLILQATIGCSWNKCTYCDMYREKSYRVRPVEELEAELQEAARRLGPIVEKVFVADGDALAMELPTWQRILAACRAGFPRLRQVSCYATAMNIHDKTDAELAALAEAGLSLLYIGPESGDPETLRRIAKGASFEAHVEAAARSHAAGLELSAIFLLGAGGTARSQAHAEGSARLATAMDPAYLAALTLTVVPGTPIARQQAKGLFTLPDTAGLLRELRSFVAGAEPRDALFRTNHASNHLVLGGRLPRDRARIVTAIDAALAGDAALRPEWARGL